MAEAQRISGNAANRNSRFSIRQTESGFGGCLFARVMREVYGPKTPAQLAAEMGRRQRTIETWLAGRVEPPWWEIVELLQRKMAEEFRRAK